MFGVCAASIGVLPPSSFSGSSAAPSGMMMAYFIKGEPQRHKEHREQIYDVLFFSVSSVSLWHIPLLKKQLSFNSGASTTRNMRQLIQGDLARVAHRAHQQRTMCHAEVHALLRALAGQESVRETRRKSISTANTIFDFKIVEL